MRGIPIYFKKRFPIFSLFIFTIITTAGISNCLTQDINPVPVIALSLIYVGFLLHLRVLDEFKDYKFDNKFHKDRPVQKGEISLSTIKFMALINVVICTTLAFFTGGLNHFLIYLFTMLYTILMFKEFFVKDFYEKSPTLYLISHQIVLVPLYYYFFRVIEPAWYPADIGDYSAFFYSLVPMSLIEIGRKMNYRYDEHGKKTKDTYYYIWGEQQTVSVFSLLVFLSGVCGFYIPGFPRQGSMVIMFAAILLFVWGKSNPKALSEKSLAITTLFALGIPALLLI